MRTQKEIEDELDSLRSELNTLKNRSAPYLASEFVSEVPPSDSSILVFHPSRKKWVPLAVGTDGQAVLADSTQDIGVAWGAASSAWLHLGI